MKYSIDEFIAAAEQELAAWKCEGEKKMTDFDYEKLGFVRAVAKRLQDQQPVLPQADVMRADQAAPLPPAQLTAIVEWLDDAERKAEKSAESFSMSHMEHSEACSSAMAQAYRLAKAQLLTIAGGNGA